MVRRKGTLVEESAAARHRHRRSVLSLIANADYLASFLATLKTGALVPLVVACVLMLARHLVQAASYDAAFEAVGHKTGFWHNVVLIFSLVFINTFCLFSGATGVAFIICLLYTSPSPRDRG